MFTCEKCDIKIERKYDYEQHLLSKKHTKTPNSCLFCEKTIENNVKYKKHLLYHISKQDRLTINFNLCVIKENENFDEIVKIENKHVLIQLLLT